MYIDNLHEFEVQRNLNSDVKRYDIINYLIEKHNLLNYLEIGVFKGENIREIKAAHKDGVDPGVEGYTPPEVNYPMGSDEFFELIEGYEDIKDDMLASINNTSFTEINKITESCHSSSSTTATNNNIDAILKFILCNVGKCS
jgi:hypothetical protein